MAKKKRKSKRKSKNPTGRPVTFKAATAAKVLLLHSNGETLRASCEQSGVVRGTFLGWVHDNRGGLADRYARAQKLYGETLLDECLEIIDDGRNDYIEKAGRHGTFVALDSEHVRRSEARVAHRRWLIDYYRAGGLLAKKDTAGTSIVRPEVTAALDEYARLKAAQAAEPVAT